MQLEGKVVIVTGGANGIGREYCATFAEAGARVVVADIDEAGAASTAARLNGSGAVRAVPCRVDVTSEEEADRMAGAAIDAFGRIDVLVNNAGVYPHVDFEDITFEGWRRVMAINLDGVFLCTRAVLDHMKAQRSGKIINISTDLVWCGLASMVHYIASKAGVVGFTRALAREVGVHGITVNAIAPGPVIPEEQLTPISRARAEEIVSHQCVKRFIKPTDVVQTALFLASPGADFITGQVVTVDGGLTTH